MVAVVLAVAACSDSSRQPIPFDLTEGVRTVLSDWRTAGLTCGEPEVGMPGPAVDWACRGDFGGVQLNARLIADRLGVQSIHAGAPPETPRADGAAAFAGLVRATSLFDSASAEIEAWLLALGGADGIMPMTRATQLGRASIVSLEDGHPVLYLVPLGSSMLTRQTD
jgi:hypothetical protein